MTELTARQRAWLDFLPPEQIPTPPFGQEPVALRPRDVARLVGLGKSEVAKLIASGDLPSFKIGSARLIAVEDFRVWIAAHRQGEVE